MSKVIELVQAHYEVQEVEMGKVYRWRPERIVIECRCGRRLSHRIDDLLRSMRF